MHKFEYFLSINLFIISVVMFSFYFKHLLLLLISLEFMMINTFFNMFILLMILNTNFYMMIMFLVMGVCEGALGLSLVIMIVRFYGNDYINSLSLMKW